MLVATFSLHEMPAPLVEQQNGIASGRHNLGDLGQMQRHGLGRAARQHQPAPLHCIRQIVSKMLADPVPLSWGAEGRVPRLAQPRAILFSGPMRLVGKRHLYRAAIGFAVPDRLQTRWRFFQNSQGQVALFIMMRPGRLLREIQSSRLKTGRLPR
jgi:hypothetical protein